MVKNKLIIFIYILGWVFFINLNFIIWKYLKVIFLDMVKKIYLIENIKIICIIILILYLILNIY